MLLALVLSMRERCIVRGVGVRVERLRVGVAAGAGLECVRLRLLRERLRLRVTSAHRIGGARVGSTRRLVIVVVDVFIVVFE